MPAFLALFTDGWNRNERRRVSAVTVFSPAKINLFLAITGRRADGFHDLVSVVAPLAFGDDLRVELRDDDAFALHCDHADVPCDDTNLVLRAARAFREASGWGRGADFFLTKRIPVGAGLGGGSSNAVATLRALNQLAPTPVGDDMLATIAAQLGSDCRLFLENAPLTMRGRGELIERWPEDARRRLSGQRLLVFKPSLGVSTVWAYKRMIEHAPRSYLPATEAEAKLRAWREDTNAPTETLLFNNMEPPVFEKYVALPVLLGQLRAKFGLVAGMSGSGSACFALLKEETDVAPILAHIRDAWGDDALGIETRIG